MSGRLPLDGATVIRAKGRRLAKIVRADGIAEGYDKTRTVDLIHAPLSGLSDLHRLLRDLAERRDCCLVRGAILDPTRTHRVRRLSNADPETGEAPTLREEPRRWIALDLDSVPLPPSVDSRDLAACARAVVRHLPLGFHGAACVVQATASQGIKPGARLRLWFWLSRALTNAECKAWLARHPVDLSLFRPAQPHYTAAPVFEGWRDPLPGRLLFLPGVPEVEPPDAATLAPPPPRPSSPGLGASLAASGRLAGANPEARFIGLLRHVLSAPEGTRHSALYWAACRAGEIVAAGYVAPEAAARALTRAAMEGGGKDARNAEQTARDGIARGVMEAPR